MSDPENHPFSRPGNVFHDRRLPEPALPVGYAALIDAYDLSVPIPLRLCAVGPRHKVYEQDGWRIYTPRHEPSATLEGHLVFALKYEGLELCVLKKLFEAVEAAALEAMILAKPSSAYMRRIWFLYEWLLDAALQVPDAKAGTYAEIVDTKLQYAIKGSTSTRHRVRNNLPGTREFCPLVRRTEALEHYTAAKLDAKAQEVVGRISAGVLARTAAFLLLKDSKSSYAIEGETPPQDRVLRWGRAIGEAGKHPLDKDELIRLQRIVIGKDNRFIKLGLRREGGFIGEHEQNSRLPIPDHISARHEDLPDLMSGLVAYDQHTNDVDPVIVAAALAFGFVYIHPFEDGNGRLHRYLVHHILAARKFSPPGLIFPVSAAILDRIDAYRSVLESFSTRLLPLVEWRPTTKMNVQVLNETADYYRYFDATPHAEFLYECVQRTIEHDLPEEAAFLQRYDTFKVRVEAIVEMPASTVDLLFNFLAQNDGELSKRARAKEFSLLTNEEVGAIEDIYRDQFGASVP